MIAINLLRRTLANEQAQRRRCQGGAALGLLILISLVTVCGVVWTNLDQSLDQLHKQKEQKLAQLVKEERLQGQVEELHRQTADLRTWSQQIAHVAVQHRQSIQLLDVVSHNLDPLSLWLTRLDLETKRVRLMGVAESRADIVQFAHDLKRDGLFQDVTVLEAGRTSEESAGYSFTMNLLLRSESDHVTSS